MTTCEDGSIPKLSADAVSMYAYVGSRDYVPQACAKVDPDGIICFSPSLCELATSSRSRKRAPGRRFCLNSSRALRGEPGMCQLASRNTLDGLRSFPISLGVSSSGAVAEDMARLRLEIAVLFPRSSTEDMFRFGTASGVAGRRERAVVGRSGRSGAIDLIPLLWSPSFSF